MSSALYFFGHPWISVAYWGILVSFFERPRAATKDRHTTGNLRIDIPQNHF